MAQRKTSKVKRTTPRPSKVIVEKQTSKAKGPSFLEKIQNDLRSQQSPSSLLLGALIVIVLAILAFNFFNKTAAVHAPQIDSQKTQNTTNKDVTKDRLPGNYTVKDGDTLFDIAQRYYNNGYLYQVIADKNKIEDVNSLTPGQILVIPKLTQAQISPAPTASSDTPQISPADPPAQNGGNATLGTGGSDNQTIWGEKIVGNTYTVQEGDWLSKIAGRAYGDIYSYEKIAKANNIPNPNVIEPGMVLTIPR